MFKSRTILQPFTIGLTVAILVALSVSNMWGMNLQQGVAVVHKEAEQRVDVLVDGQPFTSYLHLDKARKPVLFPLRTAKGTIVTRGFPLERVEKMERPLYAAHTKKWMLIPRAHRACLCSTRTRTSQES